MHGCMDGCPEAPPSLSDHQGALEPEDFQSPLLQDTSKMRIRFLYRYKNMCVCVYYIYIYIYLFIYLFIYLIYIYIYMRVCVHIYMYVHTTQTTLGGVERDKEIDRERYGCLKR